MLYLYGVGRLAQRAVWASTEPVNFDASLPVVSKWLRECKETHTACSKSKTPLPTRVIDVGPSNGSEKPFLLLTKGENAVYTALSHCWGESLPYTTTKKTLSSRKAGFPLIDLPKTYEDAIVITRRLKIRYIWIDSLCIVQDDEKDWQQESAKMASVYRNAHVTLAASASSDSHGGCIFLRSPSLHIKSSAAKEEVLVRPYTQESRSILQSPLNQRAWVLQENVLSRRTIYFATDQLFWKCQTTRASEDGLFSAPESPAKDWWHLVEDYSSRKLARLGDKYAALAGITTFFAETTGETPVAGLWQNDLHFGLLWRVDNQDLTAGDGPSWSWLSVNGKIQAPLNRDRTEQNYRVVFTPRATVLGFELQWTGQELSSRLRSGRLTLKGRMVMATIVPDDEHSMSFPHAPAHRFLLLPQRERAPGHFRECTGWVAFDHKDKEGKGGSSVWLFEVSTTETKAQGTYLKRDHDILVLEKMEAAGEWRRIGIGAVRMVMRDKMMIWEMSERIEVPLYGADGSMFKMKETVSREREEKEEEDERGGYFEGLEDELIWLI